MNHYDLTYFQYSEHAILVQWPSEIVPEILDDILLFKECLLDNPAFSKLQMVNAYTSLLINYDSDIADFAREIAQLKSIYTARTTKDLQPQRLWNIPVCYDPQFGIDLSDIALAKNSSVSEIVQWHFNTIYKVYFIGFLPGFLYLGGLDERLTMPRKTTPRAQIAKGAVAIGGAQTGIYPNASPGGWNIIGNSPLEFFNPESNSPCFAAAGDHVRFVPIDLKTHADLLLQNKEGRYKIESGEYNG